MNTPKVIFFCLFCIISAEASSVNLRIVVEEGNEIQAIREEGEVRIGTELPSPPLNDVDFNSHFSGLEADLGRAISKELNLPIRWVPLNWTYILDFLKNNKIHCALNAFFITESGLESNWGVYSRPYLYGGIAILGDNEQKVNDIRNLSYEVVGLFYDQNSISTIKKVGLKYKVFDTERSLYEAFTSRKVNFIAYDRIFLVDFLKRTKNRKAYISQRNLPGSQNGYAIVVRKTSPALLHKINHAISNWRLEPRNKKLLLEYEGEH